MDLTTFGMAGVAAITVICYLAATFGNADAVPQPSERCLSRKAGIVRCCPINS